MELVGLENVAEGEQKSLTQVSMEQLLLWNPQMIFTQYDEFYKDLENNPQWKELSAVKKSASFLCAAYTIWLD